MIGPNPGDEPLSPGGPPDAIRDLQATHYAEDGWKVLACGLERGGFRSSANLKLVDCGSCIRVERAWGRRLTADPEIDLSLPPKIRQVALLTALGKTSVEIAETLGKAQKTAHFQRAEAHRRLRSPDAPDLGSSATCLLYALRMRWIDPYGRLLTTVEEVGR